jgi:hypothetical protein
MEASRRRWLRRERRIGLSPTLTTPTGTTVETSTRSTARGDTPTRLAAVPNGSVAIDATDIYMATLDGRILKVPVEGGAPVTLARAPSSAGLVADATRLHWASFIHSPSPTADVMMLAK